MILPGRSEDGGNTAVLSVCWCLWRVRGGHLGCCAMTWLAMLFNVCVPGLLAFTVAVVMVFACAYAVLSSPTNGVWGSYATRLAPRVSLGISVTFLNTFPLVSKKKFQAFQAKENRSWEPLPVNIVLRFMSHFKI